MTTIERSQAEQVDEAALDLARETLYRFLAAALSDPRTSAWELMRDPTSYSLARQAADLLRSEFGGESIALGFGESPVEDLDLRPLENDLRLGPEKTSSDFVRVFGLVNCRECPPYETEYHPNEDTFFRSQQMADVAGFYHAFGLEPGPRERPDHLGLELEFAAYLLLKKRLALDAEDSPSIIQQHVAVCHEARKNFLQDHLCWWVPSFALALRTKAGSGFYETSGKVLAALMPIERQCLGIAAPRVPLQANVVEVPNECDGCLAHANS